MNWDDQKRLQLKQKIIPHFKEAEHTFAQAKNAGAQAREAQYSFWDSQRTTKTQTHRVEQKQLLQQSAIALLQAYLHLHHLQPASEYDESALDSLAFQLAELPESIISCWKAAIEYNPQQPDKDFSIRQYEFLYEKVIYELKSAFQYELAPEAVQQKTLKSQQLRRNLRISLLGSGLLLWSISYLLFLYLTPYHAGEGNLDLFWTADRSYHFSEQQKHRVVVPFDGSQQEAVITFAVPTSLDTLRFDPIQRKVDEIRWSSMSIQTEGSEEWISVFQTQQEPSPWKLANVVHLDVKPEYWALTPANEDPYVYAHLDQNYRVSKIKVQVAVLKKHDFLSWIYALLSGKTTA